MSKRQKVKVAHFNYRLSSLSPLLMARVNGAKMKRFPTPEEEAAARLYVDADGKLYMPFICFRNCVLSAARGIRIGKKSAYAFLADTMLNVDLHERCYLTDPDLGRPLTKADYEIDTRLVPVRGF